MGLDRPSLLEISSRGYGEFLLGLLVDLFRLLIMFEGEVYLGDLALLSPLGDLDMFGLPCSCSCLRDGPGLGVFDPGLDLEDADCFDLL